MLYRNDGTALSIAGLPAVLASTAKGLLRPEWALIWPMQDGDGDLDLFVTNFQWESNTLYSNLGGGFFADATVASGITRASMAFLGFGTGFFDCDNNGDLDLFVANGHVYDNVEKADQAAAYAQRNQLLENIGEGIFVDRSDRGPGLALVQVSPGLHSATSTATATWILR